MIINCAEIAADQGTSPTNVLTRQAKRAKGKVEKEKAKMAKGKEP